MSAHLALFVDDELILIFGEILGPVGANRILAGFLVLMEWDVVTEFGH